MKRNLKKILPNNVKPQITYTGRKLGSLFETKDLTISEHKHDAIYHGKCPVENCADDYIGETARRVNERWKVYNRKLLIIYKCTSRTKKNVKKVYLGVSEGEFKKNQYHNHQQSFRNKDHKNSTTLSTYLRSIKSTSEVQNVNLSWEIMRQAASYSNVSKQCLLYLHEKLAIALYPNPEELLNKRSEMISKCRHLNKFLLMNFNSND